MISFLFYKFQINYYYIFVLNDESFLLLFYFISIWMLVMHENDEVTISKKNRWIWQYC